MDQIEITRSEALKRTILYKCESISEGINKLSEFKRANQTYEMNCNEPKVRLAILDLMTMARLNQKFREDTSKRYTNYSNGYAITKQSSRINPIIHKTIDTLYMWGFVSVKLMECKLVNLEGE